MTTEALYSKKALRQIAFATCLLLCCSCSTQRLYTTLDVMRPGSMTFAHDAVNMLLINNTVPQPENYGHQIRLSGQQAYSVIQNIDSASLFCMAGAFEDFADIGFFRTVLLQDGTQNKSGDFYRIKPLQSAEVDSLCRMYNVDVILALNRIAVNDVISDYYLPQTSEYLAALDVKTISSWSVHYPDSSHYETINLTDSLFWEKTAYDRKEALEQLPARNDAVVDACIFAGRRACERLLPRWEQVDRYFHTDRNAQIQQGIDSVYHKDWKGALNTWKPLIETGKTKSIKAKAYANMAVVSEILGDMDNAIAYANAALSLFSESFNFNSYEHTYWLSLYVADLYTRQEELKLLEKQL